MQENLNLEKITTVVVTSLSALVTDISYFLNATRDEGIHVTAMFNRDD